MNKFIKDKKKLILIISAITTILVLILVNLTSSTTSNREIEFTTRNDEITYVNINIKAILRDESKVTNNYNANLIEQNYITQAQINTSITITPDMIFDDDEKIGKITSVDVSNSDDDSSIAIAGSDPRAATITAINGQYEYEIVWDVAAGLNKFTVKFCDTEGTEIHDQIEISEDLRFNQDISLDAYIPVESEFDGFAFMEWQQEGEALRSTLSDSYLGTTFTMGTDDLTFVAIFDGADTSYTVNFWKQNADGDQQLRDPDNYTLIDLGEDANPISAKVGDTLTVEELRRTGTYIVEKNDGGVGDTTNAFYGYKLGYIYLGDSEITQESITVTDGMEINYYVVKMLCVLTTTGETGIESTTPVNQSFEFGSRVTINATPKDGYTWKHWIDQATSSVFTTNQEFTFAMNSASVNLTAIAEPTEYTITLDFDGGNANWTNPQKYTIESNDIPLPTPTKQGYTFVGWTGDGITEPQTSYSVPTGSTGNKNFKANWAAAQTTYKVVHYQQKVDGDPSKTATQEEINANFDRAGINEYTGTTGEQVTGIPNYYPGFNTPEQQSITLSGNPNSDTINYFYTRKNITITLRPDAGIQDIDGEQDTYIFGEQVTFEATVKSGYEFDTWEGIDGADTENGLESTTLTFHVPDYNVEIEAKTIAGEYSIEYDLDGGTLSAPNPTTYHVGESFRINNPTKEGYEFGGWTGTDLSKPTKELYITNTTYGDKSYKATWLEVGDYSYQVNYWLEKANADASQHDSANYTKSNESHRVEFTGTGTEEVTETPTSIDGYVTPDAITQVVSSTSTTFDFYYERNTYVLAVKPDNQDAFTSVTGSDTYAWGDKVDIEAKTVYRHVFERWDGVDDIDDFTVSALSTESDAIATFTMPARSFTITAISSEGPAVYDYAIKYWFEKADSDFEQLSPTEAELNSSNFELNTQYTKYEHAEENESVTITPEDIEDYFPAKNVVTATITEDGQDVNVYYLRDLYEAHFEANENHDLTAETGRVPWGHRVDMGVTIIGTNEYDPNCKGFKQTAGQPVEGNLNTNPMSFIMPKGNVSFKTVWVEDLPDENEVPENNTNQTGTNDTNEVPSNEANEIPANDTNEIPANEANEVPANDTNEIPANEANEVPANDVKPDNGTTGGNAVVENQTGGGSGSGSSEDPGGSGSGGSGSGSGGSGSGSGSGGSGSGGGSSYNLNIVTGNVTGGDSTTSEGKLPQTGISNASLGAMISIIIALGIGTFILTKKNKDVK